MIRGFIRENPQVKIFLTGFSLGGNVLAKWLGEQGQHAPSQVKGACMCCAPFDLARCQENIDQGFNLIYAWKFLRTLKRKALQKARRFPDAFDLNRVLFSRTIGEFDDVFTSPIHGFKSYLHYYTEASSKPLLKNIHVPALILQAKDDPLIPACVIPKREEINTDSTIVHTLPSGGHIGFLDQNLKTGWLTEQVMKWFHALL